MKKKIFGVILVLLCLYLGNSPIAKSDEWKNEFIKTEYPPFFNSDTIWVDSVINSMTLDEKIAQLIMIPVYSNKNEKYVKEVETLVDTYQIGGIIFMQGGPVRQINVLNRLQGVSKIPMLVGMDAEWSLSMRLDSVTLYSRQMMVGAISDNNIVYDMACEFSRQLKRVGVNVNFAPVLDINNNPLNPVINDRSFGENKYNVSEKGYYYAKGLQDNNVLAVGKHFPGHGDTNVDSHKAMPIVTHDMARLDSVEFYPFRYLAKRGIGGMMISHLYTPAIDSTPNVPATLSPLAINTVLRGNIGFQGLVFTDAMNMGGITNYYKGNEADVLALLAGNDIIMFPTDVKNVITKIKESITNNIISEAEIDNRCRRILMTKYWLGLNKKYEPLPTDNVYEDLNNVDAKLMQQTIVENALTLVKNDDNIIPIKHLSHKKIASVNFENNTSSSFQERLKYYADVDNYVYPRDTNINLIDKLSEYDLVILSVEGQHRSPSRKFGISTETIAVVDTILNNRNVIIDILANPYSLAFFQNIDKAKAIIVSYNNWNITKDLSAQLIFGGIGASGKLPVSATKNIVAGMGIKTEKIRLKYSKIPEDAGVNSQIIGIVDSIFNAGILQKAYPGGQIVMARNGNIFYQKSFGYHTYDTIHSVDNLDLYDLASLTKVIATNSDMMKLYDEGKYNLNDKFSHYVHDWKHCNKSLITFKDILTHTAGLKSWIPFYKPTLQPETYNETYSKSKSDDFPYQVADSLFIYEHYPKEIQKQIKNSELGPKGKYLYSDLGFVMLPNFISTVTETEYTDYTYETFFSPLGAYSLCFNPLSHFDKSDIVPTENDKYFRHQQLHGYVHDQTAAMLGGVSGHAGLFGNANDLAKIMQMYLDKGSYGDEQFISDTTVDKFTSYQFNPLINRRGLGWDKPNKADKTKGLGSASSSDKAFGHSGYTGTMVWADPQYNMIVIILTNRVYPDAENWKLSKMNIRTNIEEAFYNAIIK